jgi:hypothetical protein
MTYSRKTRPAPWTRLKPAQDAKPSRRSYRVNKARRTLLKAYKAQRKAFLAKHPRCEVLPNLRSEEINHKFGRTGKLFLWEKGWIAVSRFGHAWIHQNVKAAQELGWLAKQGEWGKQP